MIDNLIFVRYLPRMLMASLLSRLIGYSPLRRVVQDRMISKKGQGEDNADSQVDAGQDGFAEELSSVLLLRNFAAMLHLHISSQRHSHHATTATNDYLSSSLGLPIQHSLSCSLANTITQLPIESHSQYNRRWGALHSSKTLHHEG
jgi:hypothetical protein